MRIPITAAIVLALLSGCAVPHAVRYEKPVPLVPNAWAEQEKMQHASDNVAELQTWWKAFNDPLLNRLVDRALANNLDLKIASQRLLAARAERDAISADRGPKLGIAASTLDQRSSPLVDWPRGIGVSNAQTVEFEASWEPDLFGRIKQSIEAADATAGSIEEDRRAILTSLLAEIASNYIELRSEQQRLAIAERNVARTKATYDTNVRLRSAGIVDASSLTQAHAEWQAAVAQLPIWHARVSKHSHAIAVLVGGFPGDWQVELAQPLSVVSPTCTGSEALLPAPAAGRERLTTLR
ncbi:TolC family protein [Pseudomonas aeruginosa]|uniref:TolC family protein n=1 Tax=Pseudomonas aeruginosa TaxID=287 RepID=UPI002340FDE4|nr:TolC family protein [Pseudomonas aeruginosa]MDC3806982.1 TolC family protein [Pseudomonas aeruginosa]